MKNFLKNIWDNGRKWFSRAKKPVSTNKNKFLSLKTGFHSQQWRFLLVKKPFKWSKVFIRRKYPSPIAGMKDSFPLGRKKLCLAGGSEKIYKKWFVLATESVSTTRNDAFVEKIRFHDTGKLLLLARKSKKMVPLEGKCFSFKAGSP